MASHPPYDRTAPLYTRPQLTSGPSHVEHVYERDSRVGFPQEPAYTESSARFSPTRRSDSSSYLGRSQDFYPQLRPVRAESWGREEDWHPAPRQQPSSPSYPQNWRDAPPAESHWETEQRFTSPETRNFEPSNSWRQSQRDSSNARLNLLPSNTGPVPQLVDRRWQTSPEIPPTVDYSRPYMPQDHHSFDSYRQVFYDARSNYTEPVPYRHHYDDRHEARGPLYRGPAPITRPARTSALGDYKRRRYLSGQNTSQPENMALHELHDRWHEPARQLRDDPVHHVAPLPSHGPTYSDAGQSELQIMNRTISHARSLEPVEISDSDDPLSEASDRGSSHSNSLIRRSKANIQRSVPESRATESAWITPSHRPAPSQQTLNDYTNKTTPEAPTVSYGSGRQGVMSVQSLVSPTPGLSLPFHSPSSVMTPRVVKPFATADTVQEPESGSRAGSGHMAVHRSLGDVPQSNNESEGTMAARPVTTPDVTPSIFHHEATLEENLSDLPASRSPALQRLASPAEDVRLSTVKPAVPNITSRAQSLEPDDKTAHDAPEDVVNEAVVDIAKVVTATTKQTTQPNSRPNSRPDPPPIRPKPDKEVIRETLRKAILARRRFSTQTREQRVNPILIANLSKFEDSSKLSPMNADALIQQVLKHIFATNKDEHRMMTRSLLASNFAKHREFLAEKTQRLKNEYMRLHRNWVDHCGHLDSSSRKANGIQEPPPVASGRSTRRSAAAAISDTVRSDLEMEQVMASLGNEDMTDPNHLATNNVATIPDMISVKKGRIDYLFDDTNGLIDEPDSFYDPRSGFLDWNSEEEKIFYDKYAEFPKQFGNIASFLPNKKASQCILYYYIHKKKLVDFRNAVNTGANKRRKGVRKSRKQKGNALLTDIQQTDSQRPAARGRRRRGGAVGDGTRNRVSTVQPAESSIVQEPRPKRRKVASTATPKIVMAKEMEIDESASADMDSMREAPLVSKKPVRKSRKSKVIESPPASPAPAESVLEATEPPGRRRHWTGADRDLFLTLLRRHGKDFKTISASMPNKSTVQISNFYKSHLIDLELEKVVAAANDDMARLSGTSVDPSVSGHQFVQVPVSGGPQSRPPIGEVRGDVWHSNQSQSSEMNQVTSATMGMHSMTLQRASTGRHTWFNEDFPTQLPEAPVQSVRTRALNQKSFINVLHPGAFQSNATGNPRGTMISARGHSNLPYGSEIASLPDIATPTLPQHATSSSQNEGQPRPASGQSQLPPDEEWRLPSDPRYSSFRAHLPRAGVMVADKRTPVAIQPTPIPMSRDDIRARMPMPIPGDYFTQSVPDMSSINEGRGKDVQRSM